MTPPTTRRSFLKHAALAGATFALGVRCTPAEFAPSASLPYTAREIAARLGISMAVYQKERLGARHVAAVRAAGISRIELLTMPQRFDIHDRAQVSEVLRECRRQKVTIVSVHGNLQRKYNDPDDEKRRATAAHLLDEIRFAEEAGAGILVAHFGTNDQSRKTVTELLEKTRDLRIRLTVENMRGSLRPYAAFVDKIGSKRFGLTVESDIFAMPKVSIHLSSRAAPARSLPKAVAGSGTCTSMTRLTSRPSPTTVPRCTPTASLNGARFSLR